MPGCGAVGSAPRLGRGGRPFKSDHPDQIKSSTVYRCFILSERAKRDERTESGREAKKGSENLFSTLSERKSRRR